jgi:hypothetical protein
MNTLTLYTAANASEPLEMYRNLTPLGEVRAEDSLAKIMACSRCLGIGLHDAAWALALWVVSSTSSCFVLRLLRFVAVVVSAV